MFSLVPPSYKQLPIATLYKVVFATLLVGIVAASVFDQLIWVGLPFALLFLYISIVDFRQIFFLMLVTIPLSIEIYLPNGLGTDLPIEPIIVGLMGIFIIYALRFPHRISAGFILHPIALVLAVHLVWMLFTVVFSQNLFVSVKFLLAKSWYVVTFFMLAGLILRNPADVRTMIWCVLIPTLATVCYILYRHSGYQFSFEDTQKAMKPFYRNHVTYAAILSLLLPYVVGLRKWYPRWSVGWSISVCAVIIFLLGIQFSYTRAAYVSLVIALGTYVIVRFRLMAVVLAASLVGLFYLAVKLVDNNHFIEYAPKYDKTISHQNFNDLMAATAAGEDISTMERVYRWVAGVRMTLKSPWVGYGPGNFYNFYKGYTLNRFRTYVSDNPERSTVHCYYLLMGVEQGFIGAIIFLALTFTVLIWGQRVYHTAQTDEIRRIVMMAILSTVVIDAFLLINDMIETDKVGSFFFMNMAIIINCSLINNTHKTTLLPSSPSPTTA